MSPVELIVTGVFLAAAVTVSGIFSAIETALFCLKEYHAASLAERRPELKGIIRAIARRPRKSVNQAIFLSSVVNLSLAVLALLLLRELGPIVPDRPGLSAILLFGCIVVFGDLIPTLVALSDPGLVFRTAVKPFVIVSPVIEKISSVFEKVTEALGRRLVPTGVKPTQGFTDEEFETLVEMRRDEGTLLPSESEIIQEIIRLGNKTVKDCMTPRVDALLVPDSLGNPELIAHLDSRVDWHWKIPVYGESPDVVTGFLDLRKWLRNPDLDYQEFVEAPVFVPETMMALDVFRDYLSNPRSMAVVVDEYGGVEGVISHDDMIEEILEDAAPVRDHEEELEDLGGGRLLAPGDARLDEIGEQLNVDLEREGLDTIGGLIFHEIGEVPDPGTEVVLSGLRVTVIACKGQRITEVAIERVESPPENPDEPNRRNEELAEKCSSGSRD